MSEVVWLVCQFREKFEISGWVAWDFQGVFDSEEKAIVACRDEMYCYAPVEMNKELPHETFVMKEFIYPKAKGGS